MNNAGLAVENLCIEAAGRAVVADASIAIAPGAVHALVGPNGSGKSSFALALAGHPEYRVTGGSAKLGGVDLLALDPEARAEAGLFVSFQEPPEVGGVGMSVFLKTIEANSRLPVIGNKQQTDYAAIARTLGLDESFLRRFLNEGFSGGEKKKSELLQFFARRPAVAIFDEIDSGLDIDALRAVAALIRDAASSGAGILCISHTPETLRRLEPERVWVMQGGCITASGGAQVLAAIGENGYAALPGALTSAASAVL